MRREFFPRPEKPGIPLPHPRGFTAKGPPTSSQAGRGPQPPASAAPWVGTSGLPGTLLYCAQFCLCNPTDCNPPGPSVQARIPEWFAFPPPRWWGVGGSIFLTQRSSPHLLSLQHCRRILHLLSQHLAKTLQHGFSTNWLNEESAYYR